MRCCYPQCSVSKSRERGHDCFSASASTYDYLVPLIGIQRRRRSAVPEQTHSYNQLGYFITGKLTPTEVKHGAWESAHNDYTGRVCVHTPIVNRVYAQVKHLTFVSMQSIERKNGLNETTQICKRDGRTCCYRICSQLMPTPYTYHNERMLCAAYCTLWISIM